MNNIHKILNTTLRHSPLIANIIKKITKILNIVNNYIHLSPEFFRDSQMLSV